MLTYLVFLCGCTSVTPVEGICVDKYMTDPTYQYPYPMYYVVYQDDTGYKNVRHVTADIYVNAEIGSRYSWSLI